MLKRFLPLFALAAFAGLSLAVTPPAFQAQVTDSAKVYKPGKDVTSSWGDEAIKVGQSLEGGELLRYQASFAGKLKASTATESAVADSVSSVIFSVQIQELHREWKTDDTKLARQFTIKYHQMNVSNTLNGRHWGMLVQEAVGSDAAFGKLYVEGKEAQWQSHRSLPNPSATMSQLRQDLAFGRIGQNYELIAPAHRIDWAQTHSRDLPANILDPLVFARLLFPGIGGKELKLGEALNLEVKLSTDSAKGRALPYTLSLTPRKVFGAVEGETRTANGVDVDVTASPKLGSMMAFEGGLSVAAPELKGVATLDLRRGLVVALELHGSYAGQVSGDIHISLHLEEK